MCLWKKNTDEKLKYTNKLSIITSAPRPRAIMATGIAQGGENKGYAHTHTHQLSIVVVGIAPQTSMNKRRKNKPVSTQRNQ